MWLGVSALIVGVVSFLIPSISVEIQLLLFSGLSLASVSGWIAYRKMHPKEEVESGLNQRGSEHVGRIVQLTESLQDGRGKVMLDGIPWSLTGPTANAGDKIKITAIDGNKLVFELAND